MSFQVLAIDASDIVKKGAVKRLWHLHYALDLFSLTCSQFKITEQSTGGKLVFIDWLRTVGETAEELNVFIGNSEKYWSR